MLGIDHRSARTLFDNCRKFLTPIMDRLNNILHLGGLGCDVELDESSFRSKTVGERVVWDPLFWQLPSVEAAKSG